MRPTPSQNETLLRIELGKPMTVAQEEQAHEHPGSFPLEVISYQWSRDGNAIVAHRTVRTTQTGNPRLDYRVEMYRIQRDGRSTKL